jgi:hypothetical protein
MMTVTALHGQESNDDSNCTPWRRVLLKKLLVYQLIKNVAFYNTQSPLPRWKEGRLTGLLTSSV